MRVGRLEIRLGFSTLFSKWHLQDDVVAVTSGSRSDTHRSTRALSLMRGVKDGPLRIGLEERGREITYKADEVQGVLATT